MRPQTIWILLLLGALSLGPSALAQYPEVDYTFSIMEGGVPVGGHDVIYALIVSADWWTDQYPSFVARVNVPPGVEPVSQCGTGQMEFDTASRALIWSDRLDSEVTAFKNCPLLFRVDPALVPGSTFTFTGTLTMSLPDANESNNTATLTGTVLSASDLEVTSSVDIETYRPGDIVTYTFTVTNHGPQDAQDVSLEDSISEHLGVVAFEQTSGPAAIVGNVYAAIPLLPVGSSATFRLSARARTDFEAATVRNHVVVRSPAVDLNPGNNERDLWTFAGPHADLRVFPIRFAGTLPNRIPVVVHVTNSGPDTVRNVLVSNALIGEWDLVENVTFASATPSQGVCSAPEMATAHATPPPPPYWSLQCDLGSLGPAGHATITFMIERTDGSRDFRLLSVAVPTQNDPHPGNNAGQLVFGGGTRRRAVRP